MLAKVAGAIATLGGVLLCSYGFLNYYLGMSSATGASAIQISQLANQATVDVLGGIGLLVFGAGLEVAAYLAEIRDNQKKAPPPMTGT
jgi:hypothetical protein